MFKDFVVKAWLDIQVDGLGAFVLKEKLKVLRSKLKKWNWEVFGDLNKKKKESIDKLNELEVKDETTPLNVDELLVRSELNVDIWRVSNLMESLSRQKSRILWLKDDDTNTKFFDSMVNFRRKSNRLNDFLIGGCGMRSQLW